jgi:hypothetical protein
VENQTGIDQTESAVAESPIALFLVILPAAGIALLVSMTLVGLIPHSVASPASLSLAYHLMLALAFIAFICAAGAERVAGVAATMLAATSSASLASWLVLTVSAAFFSWSGHDWADNSHFWLRFSSLNVAVLAYLILSDFGGALRVRRH